ncbi:hypothetical protein [Croceibacterium aestuarii]|uniref:hypothetical protein n=1 Tax=Croceibacterium aestuarii TaxID=3064139 RepID=UPI00272E237E|nr:hypothetical protein [Croceibacterium sp. D39]
MPAQRAEPLGEGEVLFGRLFCPRKKMTRCSTSARRISATVSSSSSAAMSTPSTTAPSDAE